jgi:hypothetical protein
MPQSPTWSGDATALNCARSKEFVLVNNAHVLIDTLTKACHKNLRRSKAKGTWYWTKRLIAVLPAVRYRVFQRSIDGRVLLLGRIARIHFL